MRTSDSSNLLSHTSNTNISFSCTANQTVLLLWSILILMLFLFLLLVTLRRVVIYIELLILLWEWGVVRFLMFKITIGIIDSRYALNLSLFPNDICCQLWCLICYFFSLFNGGVFGEWACSLRDKLRICVAMILLIFYCVVWFTTLYQLIYVHFVFLIFNFFNY